MLLWALDNGWDEEGEGRALVLGKIFMYFCRQYYMICSALTGDVSILLFLLFI
jgi:hypothetical protein